MLTIITKPQVADACLQSLTSRYTLGMTDHRYFAYGSNLSLTQMRERCPSTRVIGPAILREYVLSFPRYSRRWSGGVAGIEPMPGQHAEGVIYEINDADLRTLDGFEGYVEGRTRNAYERITVEVEVADGSKLTVLTYRANPQPGWPFPPSVAYASTIQRGAVEHGLSKALIEKLQQYIDEAELR